MMSGAVPAGEGTPSLTGLLGNEPYAAQTMVYFKPAGSRGQALHQDNYYLRVHPGTCMAAWMWFGASGAMRDSRAPSGRRTF